MSKPVTILVMGIQYKIKYLPASKMVGIEGEADFTTKTIKILDTLSMASLHSTLLHEIVHIILYSTGISELFEPNENLDEAVTLAIEHGLYPLVELKCLKILEKK